MRYPLITFFACICVSSVVWGQGPTLGDTVPAFTLDKLMNTPMNNFRPNDVKGKLLILEFWGTWCSPCIPALSHLDSLQKQFSNDLRVIAISDDSPERLSKFLERHPVSIPLASDRQRVMQDLFAYQIVPHTVVIDQQQRIVAITTPDQISASTIRALLSGQTIALPRKQDADFDPATDYFPADLTIESRAEAAPYKQGFPSFSRPGREQFKDRRITFVNVLPDMILQQAHGYSSVRTKNKRPKELTDFEPQNLTCFDFIVQKNQKAELMTSLQQDVKTRFAIQGDFVEEVVPVYIMVREKQPTSLTPSKKTPSFSMSGSGIQAIGSNMDKLRDYIEETLRRPVIDETGLTAQYDYSVDVRQEDRKQSLTESLKHYGLSLREAQRPVTFLVIKNNP